MRDELLGYYERELSFLRKMGAEFADKYPKIASRLLLESDKFDDPHVERMIEAIAFLAGRIRLKIDDEFPEITESLLNVLYPHYLAPIPSMSVVQFALDAERGKLSTGHVIPKGTQLQSRPVQGTPCRFRTSYPAVLWPIEVKSAALDSNAPVDSRGKWEDASIRISLKCTNEVPFSELKLADEKGVRPIDSLRFYLQGEPQLVYPLYEMIFNNVVAVELRGRATGQLARMKPDAAVLSLPPDAIKPVGFDVGDGMLHYTARSHPGYRLLTEYFAFPEKFLFFDITGLDAAARRGLGDLIDIVIRLRDVAPPRAIVDAGTFRLGCTPIVNLFTKTAEPIHLTHQQHEYHIIADIHRQMATEVYSIDSVIAVDPTLQQSHHYQPFYSMRHSFD